MPGPRTEVEIRAVERDDADALRRFFAHVPEGDRTFFREDVLEPGVIERVSKGERIDEINGARKLFETSRAS